MANTMSRLFCFEPVFANNFSIKSLLNAVYLSTVLILHSKST